MENIGKLGPCVDCVHRRVGCHGACEDYRAWVDNLHGVKRLMKMSRKMDYYFSKYEARQSDAAIKKDCHGGNHHKHRR